MQLSFKIYLNLWPFKIHKNLRRITLQGGATPADVPARSPPSPAASAAYSPDPDRLTPLRTCHLIWRPLRHLLRFNEQPTNHSANQVVRACPNRPPPRGDARLGLNPPPREALLPRSPADVCPAVLAAYSLPRRTAPADLPLGRANNGDAPPDGRPEEGSAATQRDPPRPAGAPPTSRWHARTCPARPPTPRPLQTGGRSLRTCLPATRGLTARVAREDDRRGAPVQGVDGDDGEGGGDVGGGGGGAGRGRKRRGTAVVPMAARRTGAQ